MLPRRRYSLAARISIPHMNGNNVKTGTPDVPAFTTSGLTGRHMTVSRTLCANFLAQVFDGERSCRPALRVLKVFCYEARKP